MNKENFFPEKINYSRSLTLDFNKRKCKSNMNMNKTTKENLKNSSEFFDKYNNFLKERRKSISKIFNENSQSKILNNENQMIQNFSSLISTNITTPLKKNNYLTPTNLFSNSEDYVNNALTNIRKNIKSIEKFV